MICFLKKNRPLFTASSYYECTHRAAESCLDQKISLHSSQPNLLVHGTPWTHLMSRLHVRIVLRHGDVEIQVERNDDTAEQHCEDGERSILKIR